MLETNKLQLLAERRVREIVAEMIDTFTMQYAATSGTGNFSANEPKVQPL